MSSVRRPAGSGSRAACGGWPVRVARLVLACALAAACALVPFTAFADDEGENRVNPQQRPDSSFIYDTSIDALGEADAYYDNQTVQVVGEVVGDNIRSGVSGRYRWITLAAVEKDSTSTVSVFMTAEQAAKIDTYGKYGTTGTKLQVRGTFHLVCSEHEGLTDLHADIVSVVEKGRYHEDVFDANELVPGAALVAVGLALMGVFYFLRERQR